MDDDAIFACATGSALHALARNRHILGRITADADCDALLHRRLIAGQFDCGEQIRTVTIFALRTVLPVLGRDWSLNPKGRDADILLAQITDAETQINTLTAQDFAGAQTRTVAHQAGDAHLTQSTQDYLLQFAIPNMWFHLSMAYATLRQDGFDIGKADFDGLHAYAPGFSFV